MSERICTDQTSSRSFSCPMEWDVPHPVQGHPPLCGRTSCVLWDFILLTLSLWNLPSLPCSWHGPETRPRCLCPVNHLRILIASCPPPSLLVLEVPGALQMVRAMCMLWSAASDTGGHSLRLQTLLFDSAHTFARFVGSIPLTILVLGGAQVSSLAQAYSDSFHENSIYSHNPN